MSLASQKETRKEQYLRLLTQDVKKPLSKDDYEAARYLKDKGYTNSPVRISNMKETYNQAINVIWKGPNSNGLDYIDELKLEIEISNNQPQHRRSEIKQPTTAIKLWHEKLWGKIIFALIFLFISLILKNIFL